MKSELVTSELPATTGVIAPPVVHPAKVSEVRALTGVRGIGAIIVVLYHFGMIQLDHVHNAWSLPHGYLAVDLFFILSGYVIALGYRNAFAVQPYFNYAVFIVKRIARLYPAYAGIGILFFLRLAFHLHGDETLNRFHLHDVIGNVLMLSGWGLHIYPLNGVAWAASAEFGSYLLLPLLLAVTLQRGPVVWLLSVMGAAAAIYAVAASGIGYEGPLDVVQVTSTLPLVRAIAGFTFGLAIFRYADRLGGLSSAAQDVLLGVTLVAIVVAACLAHGDFLVYALFVPLVALLSRDGRLAQVLFGNRLVYHLGVISYSIYLLHPLFIGPAAILSRQFGASELAFMLSTALFLAITWGLAYLSYLAVEVPGRRFIVEALLPRLQAVPVIQALVPVRLGK
jgi:peptidoglycan/LPS O-acetylase OafA/YrhL